MEMHTFKKLQIVREFIPYTNIYDKDASGSLIGKEESTSHGWYCQFSKFDIPTIFQPVPYSTVSLREIYH